MEKLLRVRNLSAGQEAHHCDVCSSDEADIGGAYQGLGGAKPPKFLAKCHLP